MKIDLNSMLDDGYSKKYALYFLNLLSNEEQSGLFDKEYMNWCHTNGFLAESGIAYNLNTSNIEDYLSDYDYYKLWPLNDWTRIWINDKLTLKYMLSNTKFDRYMPRYYYYCSNDGLRKLIDNEYTDNSFESFLQLLRKEGEFACKPCNGAGAVGFVKIEYNNNQYFINGKVKSERDVKEFVYQNPNYLYTEFIHPHTELRKIDPKIHTLRVIVLNEDGLNPQVVGGYLRFGHNGNSESNYLHTNDAMNIYAEVDFENGVFKNTKAVYINHIEELLSHPDSKEMLSGNLPNFDELKETVLAISKMFFGVEFMGFDIGLTDDGFKIMEINSHPGLTIPQMFSPYYKNEVPRNYFQKKLKRINLLNENEKLLRNNLLR